MVHFPNRPISHLNEQNLNLKQIQLNIFMFEEPLGTKIMQFFVLRNNINNMYFYRDYEYFEHSCNYEGKINILKVQVYSINLNIHCKQ